MDRLKEGHNILIFPEKSEQDIIGKKKVYDPNISYKIQRENRNYLMENISAMYYNIQYEEDLKKDDYKVCIIYYEVNDV
ncbi:hypothetical protein [Thermoanaerobacterium thermosaccharolyticum]|uniref:hypothetical protein n=1 Tax=Thermoanaerobacterium thermosaccharolyticum TaxID=1517 RepID=UPI001239E916|nr:hypothetical protein [Thermoanaerobacterium thermosaccharolyticum]KAA5808009.1 hypothetical protein F1655_02440 [Thermoanaerobacterium thermosaccharolyticum]